MSTALPGESTTALTDRERRLLSRLMSDPTSYPQAFRNWIVPFLEISDMDLPIESVHGLDARLNALSPPAGTVLLFDGDEAPEGYEFIPTPSPLDASGLKLIRST